MSNNIDLYNYSLEENMIATEPSKNRDSCKLLGLDRNTGKITHSTFHQIIDSLNKNDVLVFNQSKVFPARIYGKKTTGGNVEVLLFHQETSNDWLCISKPGLKPNTQLIFSDNLTAKVISKEQEGETKLTFNLGNNDFYQELEKIGKIPIPPYINSTTDQERLKVDYQTVYAKDVGSAAAPTAGLHFTDELIQKIKEKGVQLEYITLHVGLGTFQSLREENILQSRLHLEHFNIPQDVAVRLNGAKKDGKRIIAVGTTTTRALESAAINGLICSDCSQTEIFIYPPYKFKFVDALITNFHLPESSLLMLVSAFVSFPNTTEKFIDFKKSFIGNAYQSAVDNNYRFFSFGDAMFIV